MSSAAREPTPNERSPIRRRSSPSVQIFSLDLNEVRTRLKKAVQLHQKAHVRWENLVVSENSMGFHNPEEALRILAAATDLARRAQLKALEAVTSAGVSGN